MESIAIIIAFALGFAGRSRITRMGFKSLIPASARFDDEVIALKEAGAGLAEAAHEKPESQMNANTQENKR